MPFAKAAAVLFLRAQTPLHAGSGAPSGAIDLAIQREVHTQWPTIHSTGLKGVLRDALRAELKRGPNGVDAKTANSNAVLTAIFGPAKISGPSGGHAGCLVLTDARILAFPVFSDRGVFAWVTCKAVFDRLQSDLGTLGLQCPTLRQLPGSDCVVRTSPAPAPVQGEPCETLLLRDVEYIIDSDTERAASVRAAASWLAQNACSVDCRQEATSIFDPRVSLVQVQDEDFTYFVKYGTEVISRNALDVEKRTVAQGALFSQEFLPAETILYSLVLAEPPRREVNGLASGAAVLQKVRNLVAVASLQIGADETTGKGWCLAQILEPSAGEGQ